MRIIIIMIWNDSLNYTNRSAALSLWLLLSPAVMAQDMVSLDNVVVSATRTERDRYDVPVRTEVVTQQELRRTHARSLKEALENVPGLQLREIHGKSGYEATMQGMTSDQLLILIDGLPLAASTGSTVDLSQYSLADVGRIEIIKGAASAQYGSSAMGGVINIITREADAGGRASVTYDAGSYGQQNSSGNSQHVAQHHINTLVEGGNNRLQARLSADLRDSEGFDADRSSWVREGDASRRLQYAGRLSWTPSDAAYLSVDAQRFEESDRQWMPVELEGRLPNKTEEIDRNRLALNSGWRVDNFSVTLKGLIERYRSESAKRNLGFPMSYDERDMTLDTEFLSVQVDFPLAAQHQFQLGADIRDEELTQFKDGVSEIGEYGAANRQNYELFLQDDYFFSAKTEIIAGLRVQQDSDFGLYSSPKIALKHSLADNGNFQTIFRTSIGTGYRVPNLKERYYTFDHSSIGYKVIGNPDLQPEASLSYQAGLWFDWNSRRTLDINAFYNDIRDLIQTDEDNATIVDGIAVYTYRNISNARTLGLETVFSDRLTPAIGLMLSHTYTQAKNTDTQQTLTRRPEHIVRIGIDWQAMEQLEFNARVRYQSRELASSSTGIWSPAWSTIDLKMNYQVSPALSLFGGIDNATNTQRDFSSGTDFGPVAGRFIYLGFHMKTDFF